MPMQSSTLDQTAPGTSDPVGVRSEARARNVKKTRKLTTWTFKTDGVNQSCTNDRNDADTGH